MKLILTFAIALCVIIPMMPVEAASSSATNPAAPFRPQTPKEPYPYHVEAATFQSIASNVTLAGTLTVPEKASVPAAIVLVSGTGRFDRDEVVAQHRIFLVWADYLTRHGFAVLRYDKRGVGKSTGNFAAATDFDFADDAEGAFKFLQKKMGMNTRKIGFLGHSGGTAVVSMVAARNLDVAFAILVGARGVPGIRIVMAQDEEEGRQKGMA